MEHGAAGQGVTRRGTYVVRVTTMVKTGMEEDKGSWTELETISYGNL